MCDTWTATGGLGRSMPAEIRPPRKNRFVGVFYFLWLGFETTDSCSTIIIEKNLILVTISLPISGSFVGKLECGPMPELMSSFLT
jgi:hypothetical protein